MPPGHPVILLKCNKFNMATESVKRAIGYFTGMSKDLNSGLPRTNPTSGHAGLGPRASGIQVQCSSSTAKKENFEIEPLKCSQSLY